MSIARTKRPPVAEPEEVLAFYTNVMRGDAGGDELPTIAERCKAAEMLGRHHHLFDDGNDRQPDAGAAAAVREAMERLKERHAEGSA